MIDQAMDRQIRLERRARAKKKAQAKLAIELKNDPHLAAIIAEEVSRGLKSDLEHWNEVIETQARNSRHDT